jgi:8-oxo-dGTP pyrophosphatase MutT (NUDIX family)
MERGRGMGKPDWRVIASSYIIDSGFLRLRKDTIELPDGTIIPDYYVRDSRGFVIVLPVTPDGRIVLVRQYKHGIARELLELPAGAIDPGEAPAATAIRELAEETGYVAESMEFVRSFVTDPTNSNSVAHLFIARNAEKTAEQDLDPTEAIDVELVTVEQLRGFVRDGTIDSMPHVAAIYFLLDSKLRSPESAPNG